MIFPMCIEGNLQNRQREMALANNFPGIFLSRPGAALFPNTRGGKHQTDRSYGQQPVQVSKQGAHRGQHQRNKTIRHHVHLMRLRTTHSEIPSSDWYRAVTNCPAAQHFILCKYRLRKESYELQNQKHLLPNCLNLSLSRFHF